MGSSKQRVVSIYGCLVLPESSLDDQDALMIKRKCRVPSSPPIRGATLICIEMNCGRPPRVCMCAVRCVGLFIKRAKPPRPARITGDEVTPQSQQQPPSLVGTSEPACTYACYMFSARSLWCRGAIAFPP